MPSVPLPSNRNAFTKSSRNELRDSVVSAVRYERFRENGHQSIQVPRSWNLIQLTCTLPSESFLQLASKVQCPNPSGTLKGLMFDSRGTSSDRIATIDTTERRSEFQVVISTRTWRRPVITRVSKFMSTCRLVRSKISKVVTQYGYPTYLCGHIRCNIQRHLARPIETRMAQRLNSEDEIQGVVRLTFDEDFSSSDT